MCLLESRRVWYDEPARGGEGRGGADIGDESAIGLKSVSWPTPEDHGNSDANDARADDVFVEGTTNLPWSRRRARGSAVNDFLGIEKNSAFDNFLGAEVRPAHGTG